MLQRNKTLTHLDLSDSPLHYSSCVTSSVFHGLQHNTTLTDLNLSNTGIIATESTTQALGEMLRVNTTLKHLNLSHNRTFSDSGGCCVFLSLQHNTSLVDLNLSKTWLTATKDTAQTLGEMLQVNKTLTHLDLSNNRNLKLAGSRACSIFLSLQHNNTLVDLNLSNTGLTSTEDTAQVLGEMLRVNKTLTHLDLSKNETLADLGAREIFTNLQHNTTLTSLNLSFAEITDEGADYIAQAFECNHCLEIIDITHNAFKIDGCHCIINSVMSNATLKKIDMFCFTYKYRESVQDHIKIVNQTRQKEGLHPIKFKIGL